MAHQLEITADGTAAMFSGEGILPWHGLGTVVDGLLTAEEALQAAKLDWTVEKQPIYLASGKESQDRFAVVRTTDEEWLGVVGGDYKPFQNTEAFSFFDTVTDNSGQAHYTTAGSLQNGKRVFLTAKIGDTFNVAGEDAHDLYLLITTSHDGTKAFTAATTMVRAVCHNTVTLGLETAKTRWSLRHKTTLTGKVAEAQAALQLSHKYKDAFQLEVEQLLAAEVTNDLFKEIISDLLPKQKRQHEKNVNELMNIFTTEPTVVNTAAAGNGWGAVNAVIYWTDHVKESRSDEARFKSLTDGFARTFSDSVRDRVLATV